MRKLIKIYLIITLLLVALNLWKTFKIKPWKRVYYGASIGIAKNHPVNLYANIITQSGKKLFKPALSDEDNFDDWGEGHLTDIGVIKEQLPDSLIIEWVSLRERNIYGGTFKLPTKKIAWYYKNKKDKLITNKSYYPTTVKKYFNFDIGVAPEGEITVWIVGNDFFRKEIAHFKANEIDTYYVSTIRKVSKQESIETAIQDYLDSPKSYQYDSIINNKIPPEIDKWRNYQKKFTYYIMVKNLFEDIHKLKLKTFNKEADIYNVKKRQKWLLQSGAPQYINLTSKDKKKHAKFEFDDDMIAVFSSKQKALLPNDTLVFLLEGKMPLKSVSFLVTSINEMKIIPN